MNLENMLSKKARCTRPHIVWFHLHEMSRVDIYRDKGDEWLSGAAGRGKWGVAA